MKKIVLVLFFTFLCTALDAQTTTARAVLQFEPGCSSFDVNTGDFTFCFSEHIFPVTGSRVSLSQVQALTLVGDTQAAILTKITTVAVNSAAQYGYAVARSAVLIPQYSRGQ
jgi:hypothetical protein